MTLDGLVKLKEHEGLRLKPYTDTVGKLTVGWGRNLTDVGISEREAGLMLTNDIERATAQCRQSFDWFDSLDVTRQDAIVNLAFNLGIDGLKGFHDMLAAVEKQDWKLAANELLDSQWAKQVQKSRVDDLAGAIEFGVWD
jgi:lysozyme